MNRLSEQLGFLPRNGAGEDSGLVSLRPEPVWPERIEEREAAEAAIRIGKGRIDAILFRRFADGRSSQVAAYWIDNTANQISDEEIASLHRDLWLYGGVPLLYVAGLTEVRIFSCVRQPDFWQDGEARCSPALTLREQIHDAAAIERFSAASLRDGMFWQEDARRKSPLAAYDDAAHQRLIRAVKAADRELEGESRPALRHLLLLTVLVKYLEDRRVFPDDWFDEFWPGAVSFLDVLEAGEPEHLRCLFAELEKKFNGGIFYIPWKEGEVTGPDMQKLASLAEGRTENGQTEFWKLYSFEHIPVEVISSLYEEFAKREEGAVFTPPLVVHLLLDFALPYQGISGSERILDPTCGSGVFLVAAFKRLVLAWRAKNGWRKPDAGTLKAILKHSLYGIELNHEAAHLTSFSLALALCDALQPEVIWQDLQFDKLDGHNIVCGSFYDVRERVLQTAGAFDLVIGNPPFMPIEDKAHARSIPNREMAYSILRESFTCVREGGRVCLLQPHGILYNFKCQEFTPQLFSEQTLETVLDFASIEALFNAKVRTVALLCRKARPEPTHETWHLIFRRTAALKERLFFEVDHYDDHTVSQRRVAACFWIWRINLLGGGRLAYLYEDLAKKSTLEDFLENNEWSAAEGYKKKVRGDKNQPCDWLTGELFLPSEALQVDGIREEAITTLTDCAFNRPREKVNYTPPLVLIKKRADLPIAFWSRGFLAYPEHVFGIFPKEMTGREQHAEALKHFVQEFVERREILRGLLHLMGSPRAVVARADVSSKRDILALPWPEKGFDFCEWEQALIEDLTDGMVEFVQKGENSRLLSTMVSDNDMEPFQQMFLGMLRGVYPNIRRSKWGIFDDFTYCAFCFGERSALDWPDNSWTAEIKQLVYAQFGEALRTVRVLRYYDLNTILLVKPKWLRYWTRSTAIRDADEVFDDLRKQGY